jgi:maleylpyruvate isomerase
MLHNVTLHGYWRSSASWRVRIALHYKAIPFTTVPVHLLQHGGEQYSAEYGALNPMHQVPLLSFSDGHSAPLHIGQSLAIIELLDELVPLPALLPADPIERARVRQLAEIVNSGIQPLQNIGVLRRLKSEFGVDNHNAWCQHWIKKGLTAYAAIAATTHGRFSVGDAPSMADVCLVPQLYNARRFNVPLDDLTLLTDIEAACNQLPAFQASLPGAQPDAPPEERIQP